MARIVTSSYRHKRPARKRKAVALDGPMVVTARSVGKTPPVDHHVDAPEPIAPPPANDDSPTEPVSRPAARKTSAIMTVSRKQEKLLRGEPMTEHDDPEATARVRAWLERAKWGHGPQ